MLEKLYAACFGLSLFVVTFNTSFGKLIFQILQVEFAWIYYILINFTKILCCVYRLGSTDCNLVTIAKRIHLFPYRTQQLSSYTSKVLGWKRPGRIDSCQLNLKINEFTLWSRLFFCADNTKIFRVKWSCFQFAN